MIMSNHASYFHQHPTFPELVGTPYTGTITGTGLGEDGKVNNPNFFLE